MMLYLLNLKQGHALYGQYIDDMFCLNMRCYSNPAAKHVWGNFIQVLGGERPIVRNVYGCFFKWQFVIISSPNYSIVGTI